MSRGGMVVKPAMRLMEVRAISDSGETSSRVGTSRMFESQIGMLERPDQRSGQRAGTRRRKHPPHPGSRDRHDTVELCFGPLLMR